MKYLTNAVVANFSFKKELGGTCIPDRVYLLHWVPNVYLGRVLQIVVVLERDVVVDDFLLLYSSSAAWKLVVESCRFV